MMNHENEYIKHPMLEVMILKKKQFLICFTWVKKQVTRDSAVTVAEALVKETGEVFLIIHCDNVHYPNANKLTFIFLIVQPYNALSQISILSI